MLQQLRLSIEDEDGSEIVTTCCVEYSTKIKVGNMVTLKHEKNVKKWWTVTESSILPVKEIDRTWRVGGL